MRRLLTTLAVLGAALVAVQAGAILRAEATAQAQEDQPRQTLFVKIGRPG